MYVILCTTVRTFHTLSFSAQFSRSLESKHVSNQIAKSKTKFMLAFILLTSGNDLPVLNTSFREEIAKLNSYHDRQANSYYMIVFIKYFLFKVLIYCARSVDS